MNSHTYSIVKYSPEYKESLLGLLKIMWKDLKESEVREQFEWRYERNPYHHSPYIYLAVVDAKVVGFRAFVLQLFTLKKSIYQVFSPADAIVHPDYRRKGIFSTLNDFFLKDLAETGMKNALIVNLSSNKYSTPGYLKQGWQETDGLKFYAFRVSLLNYLKNLLGNEKQKKSAVQIVNNKTGTSIEISQSLNSRDLADFVNENRVKNRLTNLRDESYFLWRYSREGGDIFFLYYRDGGQLKGYAVVKRLSRFQFSLEEYLAADQSLYIELLQTLSKILSISILRTWNLSQDDRALLSKSNFFPEPAGLLKILGKQRLPVLVRPVAKSVKEDDFIIADLDMRHINNWQLYLADKH